LDGCAEGSMHLDHLLVECSRMNCFVLLGQVVDYSQLRELQGVS